MKTKTKIVVLVEIAIVLCSLFLVAIPAIAAEQNQTMQKVSASEVTTASEDDYVLGIYGNGNEDDTIDMGDVVYTKLAIFGKKPKTELCDAKYDGRINVLDVIQTKLIILGKEKELTFLDWGLRRPPEPVTVCKPVKRIVVMGRDSAEALRALNAVDRVIGVDKGIQDNKPYFPELSKLQGIGQRMGPGLDYEAILALKPDVFLTFTEPKKEQKEKLPGITAFSLGFRHPVVFTEGVIKLGYILDKKEEAAEFVNWHESCKNTIKERTEGLSEGEKRKVFLSGLPQSYSTAPRGRYTHEMCVIAGGKNIAEDLEGTWPKVDPEWVIMQNPDIILSGAVPGGRSYACGYGVDDPSEMAAAREDILNLPELAEVTAVKKKCVYMMTFSDLAATTGSIIGTAYMAKWFYPDLFEDLDPKAIHQEFLTEFQKFDYNLDKHGVFVYPEPS